MWPLVAASPYGSGASGSCHCGWAPWLLRPTDTGRVKGSRRPLGHRGCRASPGQQVQGPSPLPVPPRTGYDRPRARHPRPRPKPRPGPCQRRLRAQAQAHPAAPAQGSERPLGPARPAAQPPAGGWRRMEPPGRSSTPTHLPPRQMADRKRKRRPRARRKCRSAGQWAAPPERRNEEDGAGSARRQLHRTRSKDGVSLKGQRTPSGSGPSSGWAAASPAWRSGGGGGRAGGRHPPWQSPHPTAV